MSSRLYPLYQLGNPQLRIFLPNFWMKLVRNTYKEQDEILSNRVQFIVSMGMTRHDVINYLDKIYNVPVVDVRLFIKMGKTKRVGKTYYVVKEDDYKMAMVTLPENMTFKFPELFPQDKMEKQMDEVNKATKDANAFTAMAKKQDKITPGIPGWFGGTCSFKKSAPPETKEK